MKTDTTNTGITGPGTTGPGIAGSESVRSVGTAITAVDYESDLTVSFLENAVSWFLDCVVIVKAKEIFRLLVLRKKRLRYEKTYNREKDARMGFSKMFGDQVFSEEVKQSWSHYYKPEATWYMKLLKVISDKSYLITVKRKKRKKSNMQLQ